MIAELVVPHKHGILMIYLLSFISRGVLQTDKYNVICKGILQIFLYQTKIIALTPIDSAQTHVSFLYLKYFFLNKVPKDRHIYFFMYNLASTRSILLWPNYIYFCQLEFYLYNINCLIFKYKLKSCLKPDLIVRNLKKGFCWAFINITTCMSSRLTIYSNSKISMRYIIRYLTKSDMVHMNLTSFQGSGIEDNVMRLYSFLKH